MKKQIFTAIAVLFVLQRSFVLAQTITIDNTGTYINSLPVGTGANLVPVLQDTVTHELYRNQNPLISQNPVTTLTFISGDTITTGNFVANR